MGNRKKSIGKSSSSRPNIKLRLVLIQSVFILMMLFIAIRLYHIQILKHDFFSAKVLPRKPSLPGPLKPRRGIIYDRGGRELAMSINLDSVYGVPGQLQQEDDATIRQVCNILQVHPGFLDKKLDSGRGFVWLKRKVTPDIAKQLEELGLEGIGFREESQRYFPGKSLAAHVVGFTGLDHHGLEGAELYFDDDLLKENDILLTIDRVIQYQTEKILSKCCEARKAKAGMVIVMDVESGEILAMANWPTYNLNSFAKYKPHVRRNRCLTDAFEPGSVFKIFLAAATLEEGILGPKDIIYCEDGVFKLSGKTIHDIHPNGWLSFSDIIKESSNIGAAKIGLMLGEEKFRNSLQSLGFGTKTGIQLPGESGGKLNSSSRWTKLTTANVSFGHGVLVTPLQLITAINCVANQGEWKRPKIRKGVMDETGKITETQNTGPGCKVFSEKTCLSVTRMLEAAVENGTGKAAYIPGFRVSGKTGTAQKIDPLTRHYSRDLVCSSFVGFFPANAPKISILVTIDEPKGEHLAGVVAAPVFRAIAENVIYYLHMLPENREGEPAVRVARNEMKEEKR